MKNSSSIRTAVLAVVRSIYSRFDVSEKVTQKGKSLRPGQRCAIEALESRTLLSYTVTSLADTASSGTLRWAIAQADSAGGNQTIVFSSSLTSGGPATIDLAGTALELNDTSGTLTIEGPGAGLLSINGEGDSSVFTVDSGSTAVIEGLTITNGHAAYGGGIYNEGTLTITNSMISDNSAIDFGGGINNQGTLTVIDSTISGNTVSSIFGGGIYSGFSGNLTINSSTISGNYAANNGGGIFDYGAMTITDSTLSGNSSPGLGGGIYGKYGCYISIIDSTICGNSASDMGGGVGVGEDGNFAITDCTISGNEVGGIINLYGTLTVTDSTITGNSASTGPGGIHDGPSSTTLISGSIVADNTNGDLYGSGFSGTYDLIGDGSGGLSTSGSSHNILGTTGSRIDPDLAPLGYYGGPTETMPLLSGSPALAAGASFDSGTITTDQRGFTRPTSTSSDIGAFQVQSSPLVVNTTEDDPIGSGLLSLRDAINLADAMGGDQTITFASSLTSDGPATIDLGGTALTLDDTSGTLTIDGGGLLTIDAQGNSGVFIVDSGSTAELDDLTITDGSNTNGGGIKNLGTLNISYCYINNNSASTDGGGIYNGGTLTITGSALSDNAADVSGPDIYNDGTLTVTDSTMSNLTVYGEDLSAIPNESFNGIVADFSDAATDADSQTYTASINWGDTHTSSGTVASDGNGGFKVTGSHTYDAAGSFTPTVSIRGGDWSVAATYGTANVAGLTADSESINAVQGTAFSDMQVADFSDNAPDASGETYTAFIDWGDGSSASSGTVASDGEGGYTVTGSHTYSAAGNYSPVVTITASDSRTVVADVTANVTSLTTTGETISPEQGTSVTGEVATFTDANSGTSTGQYTATIYWGDGNISAGTIAVDGGGFSVTGTNTYLVAGAFNPIVTITDPSGATATATATANVAGLTAEGQEINAAQGDALSGVVLATFDDNASDHSSETYTASIDWGDGSSASTGTVTSDGEGGYTVAGSHTYDSAGSFTPTVTITATDARTVAAYAGANVAGLSVSGESIAAGAGVSYTGEVADFSDSALDAPLQTYTASIDWGDGSSSSSGTLASDGNGGFTVTGTHTYSDAGNYTPTITVTASDSRTGSDSSGSANVSSLSATGSSFSASQGADFFGTVATFTDSNSGTNASEYSAIIDWGDGNESSGVIVADGSGFDVIGTNNFVQAGTLNPTVTITDPYGGVVTAIATATVAGLTATGESVNAAQGTSYTGILATFSDNASDESSQTYTASINWGDGNISTGTVASITGGYTVTGTHTYDAAGDQSPTITISASDGRTVSTYASATVAGLNVNEDDVSAVAGTSFTGTVADFMDSAPDGPVQSYTASIDWGDGSSASSGAIASDGNGGFTVTGTHTYADAGNFMPTVTVTASDSRTGIVSDNANVTSVTVTGETVTPNQGTSFTGEVATFTDSNSGTTANEYSATIDWGDGNESTGVIVSNGSGGFNVTGTNNYAVAGTYNPTITITDPNGGEATGSATANVAGVSFTPQTITEDQGSSFSGVELTDFTDTASDHSSQTYTAVIDWGDGDSSTGTVASDGSGGYTVSGGHTYDTAGSYTPIILVSSTDGRISTGSATANVNGLTVDSETINAVQGTAFTNMQVADFADSASDASSQTYTASIDWGDGSSSSTGTVASDGEGGFTVTGSHTYSTAGSYSAVVTITASDSRTMAADVSSNVTSLTATGETITPDQGSSFTDVLANFTDANSGTNAGDYSASIDWGDGNTSTGVITSDGSGFNVSGTNNYAVAGMFNPTITITDHNGATATATATANVTGLAFTGQTITVDQGSSFSGVELADFTDTASDHSSQTYTAVIDWGDGSSTSMGTVASDGSGGYTVSGSHVYDNTGSYTPTIIVSAGDGRVSTGSATANVNGLTVDSETINAVQGAAFTDIQIADFADSASDASSETYTASIDWGDGSSSSSGTITSDGEGGFTVTGSHTYSTAGYYSPVVSITASDSRAVEADATANVTSLTATGETITPTQGTSFTDVVANFTDANSGTSASDYIATIDWGDGNTSNGAITSDGSGGFNVTGSNTYSVGGTFNPTITIVDPSGATATTTATANVSGMVITANTISPISSDSFTGVMATFIDNASDHSSQTYTASIDWGDGNTSTGTVLSDGSGGFTVTGTHTFTTAGTFSTTITIDASDGRVGSGQGVASMPEIAPLLSATAVSDSEIDLTFTPGSLNLQLEEQGPDDNNFHVIDMPTETDGVYPITDLESNEPYSFRLRADNGQVADYSAPAAAITDVGDDAPEITSYSYDSSDNYISLNWSESADIDIVSVDVYESAVGSGLKPEFDMVDTETSSHITLYESAGSDLGLPSSIYDAPEDHGVTAYQFYVQIRYDDLGYFYTAPSNVVTIQTPLQIAARTLSKTSSGGTTTLSWNPVEGADNYILEYTSGSDPTWDSFEDYGVYGSSTTSVSLSTSSATGLIFAVEAEKNNGDPSSIGDWYAQSNIVGQSASTPTAPSNLAAVGVDLLWNDNSNNEDYFVVERSLHPFSDPAGPDTGDSTLKSFIVPADTSFFEDTTVQAAANYYYRVAAVNSGGSSYSSSINEYIAVGTISLATKNFDPYTDVLNHVISSAKFNSLFPNSSNLSSKDKLALVFGYEADFDTTDITQLENTVNYDDEIIYRTTNDDDLTTDETKYVLKNHYTPTDLKFQIKLDNYYIANDQKDLYALQKIFDELGLSNVTVVTQYLYGDFWYHVEGTGFNGVINVAHRIIHGETTGVGLQPTGDEALLLGFPGLSDIFGLYLADEAITNVAIDQISQNTSEQFLQLSESAAKDVFALRGTNGNLVITAGEEWLGNVPQTSGVVDVFAHGSPGSLSLSATASGTEVTPQQLLSLLKYDANYKPGDPIRLIACSTGQDLNGYAQQLADLIQAPVIAPTQNIVVFGSGEIVFSNEINNIPASVNGGIWQSFVPQSWLLHIIK